MKLKSVSLCAVVCALGVAAACSKSPSTPASPSTSTPASTDAAADGTTLKITAPTAASPINAQRLESGDGVTLRVANGTPKFGGVGPYTYHYEVYNQANQRVVDTAGVAQGSGTTSYVVPISLAGEQTYTWRSRVEMGSAFGPWSSTATFFVPVNEGYIKAQEIYDPLDNGKTVGTIVGGPTQWIPGKGLRILSQLAYVYYQLPQTLAEGEFSLIVTDMAANTDGDKTKLFAMAQGFDDIVTNDRRMTVEKRGDPAGIVAWRFITHDDQVDTEGAERTFVNFVPSQVYFWRATWRANNFRVIIREGGADGREIYNIGKNFTGRPYDPAPHVVYLGSPVGRSGEAGASVDNVTYRQIWVSNNPRPAYANK